MIHSLEEILKKPKSYQRKFLMNCEISEKIAAYYFHVKIASPDRLVFYRSSYQEIRVEDVIMNRMWMDIMRDFNEMLLNGADFFKAHVGWMLSFFYFPTTCPLGIWYDNINGDDSYSYIIGNVKNAKSEQVHVDEIDLTSLSSKIRKQSPVVCPGMMRSENQRKAINEAIKEGTYRAISRMVAIDLVEIGKIAASGLKYEEIRPGMSYEYFLKNSKIGQAEGFILRHDGDIYQMSLRAEDVKTDKMNDNRFCLEFLLHNFAQFLSKSEWQNSITKDYVKTVCNLFWKYKTEHFDIGSFSYYRIKASDLAAPNFGYYPGTCFELIPDKKVREACQSSEIDDNILKILLNGLKKHHKYNSNSAILSKSDVEQINECVTFIKSLTINTISI